MVTRAEVHPYLNGTRQGDVGYLVLEVPDLERAMTFYQSVLDWTFSPGSSAQGRRVEGVAPMTGLASGQEPGGLIVCWRVDDIAAAVNRVRTAGGIPGERSRSHTGTRADCRDDQGARFYLWQPTDEQAAAERAGDVAGRPLHGHRHGDVSYLTLEVRDADRARAFYGAVLGWEFHTNNDEDPDNTMPMIGLWGDRDRATGVAMYRVDDVNAAVARVRGAGGTATEPERKPYGMSADCADDQGIRFYLGED